MDLALISRSFEAAICEWGFEYLENQVKRVKKPKLPGGRTRKLEKREEERLLEACNDKFRSVIEFALETAMRRAEIAEMTWDTVDFKRRSVLSSPIYPLNT